MIAVVQRVNNASVDVEDVGVVGEIGIGLCVLLGVVVGDTEKEADWIAGKIARLRIFEDASGRFNLGIKDVGGRVLLISQFTLAGDCTRGNRPSFIRAADPDGAKALYERVARTLVEVHELRVETGRFQKTMQVRLENQGPATIILDTAST
ncbi:MAG: D-aminoacyl-tRNA deacylase [Phycisphaerales bacterium]|jgi:D-tyrosyl-tRNA(Tyr) deacylase|nr:D-aminoacyl-tRNA deacylase [Phycisphaerales bacterium]